MATLADGHRITLEDVNQELAGIECELAGDATDNDQDLLLVQKVLTAEKAGRSYLLNLKTPEAVLEALKDSGNMAETGRNVFAVSRLQKTHPNDSDWVRKLLALRELNSQECSDKLRNS